MKWTSSSDSAGGPFLRTRLTLAFLTASATILALAAICLAPGRESETFPHLAPLVGVLALAGIALVAWLLAGTARSLTHSLSSCTRLAQALAEGRQDEAQAEAGGAETTALAAALNRCAARLKQQHRALDAICGSLASLDGALRAGSSSMGHGLRRQETDMRQLVPQVARMEQNLKDSASALEGLLTVASTTGNSTRAMVAASERLAAIGDNLGASLDEVEAAVGRMDATSRSWAATIAEMLAMAAAGASSRSALESAVRQAEKSGQDTRSIVEGVSRDIDAARRATQEAITGMGAIRGASSATAEAIANLSRRAEATDAILPVITDLAEQTDLLALNATIIATQAGDMGRDFSIIADEIRELSERTGSSTREIAAIVHGIRDESRHAVESIGQVEDRIAGGERLARQAALALEVIVSGMQQALLQMDGIGSAGLEQARVVRELLDALGRINDQAQRIARSSADQHRLTEFCLAMLEQLGTLTSQVRSLAREQRHDGALALQATATLAGAIGQLRDGVAAPCALTPTATLETLQTQASSSGDGLKALDAGLDQLGHQVRLLREQLASFSA